MPSYTFIGLVHPQRAQLSMQFGLKFTHITSGKRGSLDVSTILNQVLVKADCEDSWDILDLRNVVQHALQTRLACLAYLKGYAYELEVTRVTCPEENVDYVFGVDIPFIEQRNAGVSLDAALKNLERLTKGEDGVHVVRCLHDLSAAMRFPDDTAFYCYRAVESLRHHCARRRGLSNQDKAAQWQALRAVSGLPELDFRELQISAEAVRHGDVARLDGVKRNRLFEITWNIVDAYFNAA